MEDELAFAMCNFGYEREVMRERILYASKACGLEDMLNRSPLKLSGGQQQRLAIACILALQPRVIILDESTSQLDPLGRDEVFQLVTKLHAKGTTVIMVDHNIEKIAEYADKVLVLHEGKVVVYDDTHKVFQQKELFNQRNAASGVGQVPPYLENLVVRQCLHMSPPPVDSIVSPSICNSKYFVSIL